MSQLQIHQLQLFQLRHSGGTGGGPRCSGRPHPGLPLAGQGGRHLPPAGAPVRGCPTGTLHRPSARQLRDRDPYPDCKGTGGQTEEV